MPHQHRRNLLQTHAAQLRGYATKELLCVSGSKEHKVPRTIPNVKKMQARDCIFSLGWGQISSLKSGLGKCDWTVCYLSRSQRDSVGGAGVKPRAFQLNSKGFPQKTVLTSEKRK